MTSPPDTPLPDITNRADIDCLVGAFYAQVKVDDVLGPIFNDIAGVDWDTHVPKIGDFWETALFRTGNYKGNPLRPHLLLSQQTSMGRDKFDHWLSLFYATVDTHFSGENAGHIKRIAEDMARVMHGRIEALDAKSD